MAASDEKTTFGASIVPTDDHHADEALIPPPRLDSPALTPAVSRDDMSTTYEGRPIPVHSPFYQHPPASFERVHSRQTSKTNLGTYEKDLETGDVTPLAATGDENPFTSKISVDCNKECKMWPSRQTLMEQKTAEKRKQRAREGITGCVPMREWWAKQSKRQRLIIKIILAFFVVGAIVAIGVGISAAVHGTYYSNHGQQQVGDDDSS